MAPMILLNAMGAGLSRLFTGSEKHAMLFTLILWVIIGVGGYLAFGTKAHAGQTCFTDQRSGAIYCYDGGKTYCQTYSDGTVICQ